MNDPLNPVQNSPAGDFPRQDALVLHGASGDMALFAYTVLRGFRWRGRSRGMIQQ